MKPRWASCFFQLFVGFAGFIWELYSRVSIRFILDFYRQGLFSFHIGFIYRFLRTPKRDRSLTKHPQTGVHFKDKRGILRGPEKREPA